MQKDDAMQNAMEAKHFHNASLRKYYLDQVLGFHLSRIRLREISTPSVVGCGGINHHNADFTPVTAL